MYDLEYLLGLGRIAARRFPPGEESNAHHREQRVFRLVVLPPLQKISKHCFKIITERKHPPQRKYSIYIVYYHYIKQIAMQFEYLLEW